eukprot:791341-Rhodomonas_salina.1
MIGLSYQWHLVEDQDGRQVLGRNGKVASLPSICAFAMRCPVPTSAMRVPGDGGPPSRRLQAHRGCFGVIGLTGRSGQGGGRIFSVTIQWPWLSRGHSSSAQRCVGCNFLVDGRLWGHKQRCNLSLATPGAA